MNSLESATLASPYGTEDECGKFIINDPADTFKFVDVMMVGNEYTFSCWIRSEYPSRIMIRDVACMTSPEWSYHVVTFTAGGPNLGIAFTQPDTYYIYHAQLELGNVATDWTPAPEDIDEDISDVGETAKSAQDTANDAADRAANAQVEIDSLLGMIEMLVTDENGESLMTQTADGWTFCTSQLQGQVDTASELLNQLVEELGSTEAAIEALSNSVEEFGVIAEYVRISTYEYTDENGEEQVEPAIDLFETDTGFKLKITNTRIVFTDGANEIVTVNSRTRSLITPKSIIEEELQIGSNKRPDGVWIWKQRANGNLGLLWSGSTTAFRRGVR
jgi:hypothetical protein